MPLLLEAFPASARTMGSGTDFSSNTMSDNVPVVLSRLIVANKTWASFAVVEKLAQAWIRSRLGEIAGSSGMSTPISVISSGWS